MAMPMAVASAVGYALGAETPKRGVGSPWAPTALGVPCGLTAASPRTPGRAHGSHPLADLTDVNTPAGLSNDLSPWWPCHTEPTRARACTTVLQDERYADALELAKTLFSGRSAASGPEFADEVNEVRGALWGCRAHSSRSDTALNRPVPRNPRQPPPSPCCSKRCTAIRCVRSARAVGTLWRTCAGGGGVRGELVPGTDSGHVEHRSA